MDTINKLSCSLGGLFCLFVAIWLVGCGVLDVYFNLRGKTAIATIESATKEFAGFSNDEVSGTQPQYRYRITYSFDAEGTLQSGETTSGVVNARAKTIPVQYIPNAPKRHRFLTPSFQYLRFAYWIGFTLTLIFCVSGWIENRMSSRTLIQTDSN